MGGLTVFSIFLGGAALIGTIAAVICFLVTRHMRRAVAAEEIAEQKRVADAFANAYYKNKHTWPARGFAPADLPAELPLYNLITLE